MTLLLFGLALAVLVTTHVVLQRRLAKLAELVFAQEKTRRDRLDELEAARTNLLYKQQKQSGRVVQSSNRAVLKLSDEVRRLHQDAVEMHKSVDRMIRVHENG